jgi:hypothetical protein
MFGTRALPALTLIAALSACASEGELVLDEGVGIASVLSICPSVGIPDYTGDVTTFRSDDRSTASLDVSAAMTDLRATCNDTADQVYSEASFTVKVAVPPCSLVAPLGAEGTRAATSLSVFATATSTAARAL